jgi:hypothetical protein
VLTVGSTLLIPTPPKCTDEHLYIIIAVDNSGKALLVSVTTYKKGCDASCVLRAGQHRFLTHLSVISYADAQIVDISILEDLLERGLIKSHDPVRPIQLSRIQRCGLKSQAIPRKCLDFLAANI